MTVEIVRVGDLGTNCYLAIDDATGECAVVDPGGDGEKLAEYIAKKGLKPTKILLTHSHFDHILGIPALRERWPGIPVYCHPDDCAATGDTEVIFGLRVPTLRAFGNITHYGEGDTVAVGGETLTVLHTPGHSPGSVTLMGEGVLFTGDTLFRGSMGRTDLPGGSFPKIMDSLARLANLEGDFAVYPGHESTSTLSRERASNYCVREALAR